VVAHGPGVVELRSGIWNPRSVTLTDSVEPSRLLEIIDHLDGSASEEDVARSLGVAADQVRAVVEQLVAAGAAANGPIPGDGYMRLLGIGARTTAPSTPTDRRVTVIGDGRLSVALREALADFATPSTLGRQLTSGLLRTDPAPHADGLESLRWAEAYRDLSDSFVVVATEVVNPMLLQNVNRLALTFGFSWMQIALDGPFVLVGPTFIPRRSPCYECFEQRLGLAVREHSNYQAYKRALADGFVREGSPVLPRPIEGMLANLGAIEVCGFLLAETSFTVGRVLSIYLPAFEFSFNEFLRLPSCRACVPAVESNETQLHFDLRSYIGERRGAAAE
jgi:bacteriocin biosynthesis cyclodehydratase domain-containing protein